MRWTFVSGQDMAGLVVFSIAFELVWGLVFGLEHADLEPEEEDDPKWLIAIHAGILRIMFVKY